MLALSTEGCLVATLIEAHTKESSSVAVASSNLGHDVNFSFSFLNKNNKIQTRSIHYKCIILNSTILNSTLTYSYDLQRYVGDKVVPFRMPNVVNYVTES